MDGGREDYILINNISYPLNILHMAKEEKQVGSYSTPWDIFKMGMRFGRDYVLGTKGQGLFPSIKKKNPLRSCLWGCNLIIGPPKSGKGLVCSILSQLGIDFGYDLKIRSEDIINGRFEDKKFIHHNHKLMRFMVGYGRSSDFGYFLLRNYKERLKELYLMNKVKGTLKNLEKRTKMDWGVKDPALCITFRRLHTYFINPKIMYVIRDPAEIMLSEVINSGISPTKAINLWNECALNIINYKLKFGGTIILYHKLISKDQRTLDKIKQFVYFKGDNKPFDIINDKLYMSKGKVPVPQYTKYLWEFIKEME